MVLIYLFHFIFWLLLLLNKNFAVPTNNNYDDEDSDRLKIDEDADPGKENLESKMEDDIAEVDGPSNGVSEEEEEPSMPGPAGGLDVEAASE